MKKKNILKVCGALIAMPLILAGCATVSNVTDPATGKNAYFNEITYFGGEAAKIGDYLYYGNSYHSVSDSGFNYNNASESGYLARININSGISDHGDLPTGIEKVNKKLAGFDNQYMFAYQNYIYFTSANTHKTASQQNDYTRVTMFRMKFNGDGVKELFTTRYDSSSFIQACEGSDGSAYVVTYAKPESSASDGYEIQVMKIGDKMGSREVVAKDVTSAAADTSVDSTDKNVYYTKAAEIGSSTTEVFSLDLASKESTKLNVQNFGSTTTLIDKVGDSLFYTYNNVNYMADLTGNDITIGYGEFYNNGGSISNVIEVAKNDSAYKGYVLVSNSQLMYKNAETGAPKKLLDSSDFSDVLFADGDYVYFSNSTSIGRVSFKDGAKQTIVTMESIISGKYSYIDGYIYYYAKFQPEAEYDEDGEEIEYEEDASVYMYRVKAGDPSDAAKIPYQLVSKIKDRVKVESDD